MNIKPPAANNVVLPFTAARAVDPANPPVRRLPGVNWLPDIIRNHLVAVIGEFIGTFLFLFFAFTGTHVANQWAAGRSGPQPVALLYISLSFGFSLAVNAWTFFRISGGLFNPAASKSLLIL
jgi:aquaporin rerated protein, other eukaryote